MFEHREIFFGVLSGVIALGANIAYLVAIIRGAVKPHRMSFGIWSILNAIFLFNQIHNGGGYSVLFNLGTSLAVFTFFALSIKRGMGGSDRLDVIVLTMSVVLFIVWVFTQDTRRTTIIAVLIDACAAVPLIVKSYKHPHTETYVTWILTGIAAPLSLLALEETDYILFVFPIYVFIGNSAIVLAKFFGTRKLSTGSTGSDPANA